MGRVILLVLVGATFAVIFLETLSGCGERTYFQNRTWVTGECLFIPFVSTSGRW
jgi:hypothetical protein